jgi:erythritol transport system permease protein
MKTTQSVALAPQKGAALSGKYPASAAQNAHLYCAVPDCLSTHYVPGFLSAGSLVIMIKHIAINAFLALGITFVIITAGIDLSIGATLACAA